MFSTIKRWLGSAPRAPINSDPFNGRRPQPARTALATVPAVAPAVFLQREEIIDARTRIAGYRFEPQHSDLSRVIDAVDVFAALRAADVAAFAERRLALLPVKARDWFKFDYAALTGPHTVFLLDRPPVNTEDLDRWREAVRSIRATGARVALASSDASGEFELVRDSADWLLLDFPSYSLPNFEQLVRQLTSARPTLKIVAANVGSWAERRYCVTQGVAFCMGTFTTAASDEQKTGEINQNRLTLIEMLNLVRRDADFAEIAEVAKRDPGVAVKIVAMANSPAQGLAKPVAGIDQAFMVLGREQLYRWLSIGMFRAGSASPRDEVLLELALRRGRFLELVDSDRHDKAGRDELFLVGLLSLLDCMLGVPMTGILERMHLSAEMRDVLLHGEGPLARHLLLAIAVEKGRVENIARLAEQLAISDQAIAAASTKALAWAEEAMRPGK